LFEFEKDEILNYCPSMTAHSKCVDMSNPITPIQRPRGYGGTAILWNQDLDHLVQRLPDGNERITAITLEQGPTKLCIMSVYFPCRGTTNCDTEFIDTLDQVHEIMQKYSTYTIIIGTDFNAKVSQPTDKRDIVAAQFIKDNNLKMDPTTKQTFYHHNGRD
jgi:exonuclease III